MKLPPSVLCCGTHNNTNKRQNSTKNSFSLLVHSVELPGQ